MRHLIFALLTTLTLQANTLPVGSAPDALAFSHFPDPLHAFVWRNWELVPAEQMAKVAEATPGQILEIGRAMGLPNPPLISEERRLRSYITVIRRNWHLLPYDQLLTLLNWTAEELNFTLREDDFLHVKLGRLKPKCEPIKYTAPSEAATARAAEIAAVVAGAFPKGVGEGDASLFDFVEHLSAPPSTESPATVSRFSPRFCSSYFALYGDPLLETDPYPDGYLARLAASGVDGVWLPAVLYKLAPFPWDSSLSEQHEERLEKLRELTARARRHGVSVYLYLNEPRTMPLAFFEKHPELRGVNTGDYAALCVSTPEVDDYLRESIAYIAQNVPGLAGFFTITASENPTNCWSHGKGADCKRCAERGAPNVIAGVNATLAKGLRDAGTGARLIAWDWGWADAWAGEAIGQLPPDVALMSVSEWSIPINRGGVNSVVGEYSISTVGPGPRATRHWKAARDRGLKVVAKIQAGNTWELSAVPYIPAVENVARHAANLGNANINGVMLGWTLGGYPSPNLEVVAEMGTAAAPDPNEAMLSVAGRRFGRTAAPVVVEAWRAFSRAFSEFPYHIGVVYNAPLQAGPANLLWQRPTGYRATMVGIPYDDLNAWRAVYPPAVFAGQMEKIADGFDAAIRTLDTETRSLELNDSQRKQLGEELDIARVCAIHFRSVANQTRFIMARDANEASRADGEVEDLMVRTLRSEIELAKQLYSIQRRDSRMGFEATNQYFYTPLDLVEKVINCEHLLSLRTNQTTD